MAFECPGVSIGNALASTTRSSMGKAGVLADGVPKEADEISYSISGKCGEGCCRHVGW
jgi:hypothetical protein